MWGYIRFWLKIAAFVGLLALVLRLCAASAPLAPLQPPDSVVVERYHRAHAVTPKMIVVSTTCMAEVIGDDLHAFIGNAKKQGSVPEGYDVPAAHTPAFQGSHVNGYDNMLHAILGHFQALTAIASATSASSSGSWD